MANPLLVFTWIDVRAALETLADTSQQRRAAWLLERLKQDSVRMSPDKLLVEIISSAILLGADFNVSQGGRQSLLDG